MADKGDKALFDNSGTIVMPKVLIHIGKVLVRVDITGICSQNRNWLQNGKMIDSDAEFLLNQKQGFTCILHAIQGCLFFSHFCLVLWYEIASHYMT